MKQTNALLIRRVIAIILMACTIVFLFWPSFLCEKAEYEYYGEKESYTYKFTLSEIRSSSTDTLEQAIDEFDESTEMKISVILTIFLNVAFFGMIALAGMSIILMLFNRSKAATVLHTILAILTVLVFVAYFAYYLITYAEEMKEYGFKEIVYPGVAGVLLPLFSLAASILYKRDKSYKGILPPRAAQPAYAAPAGQPPVTRFAPASAPVVPPAAPKAPAEWICPSCTAKNDPTETECPYCGTKNPAPVPVPAPEPAFEAPSFCTNCGAKQRPGASFCPQCGSKLI